MAPTYTTGVQYVALVISGTMYKDAYQKMGLHPKNLSTALEDSGTLVAPLIPWSTDGAFISGALGILPLAYIPFAFLNLINPLVSIFYGFTGITMEKLSKEEKTA
ncbi:Na+/H+ antiporter NhaC family protein [Clostridiaceae bacterium 35-E11]